MVNSKARVSDCGEKSLFLSGGEGENGFLSGDCSAYLLLKW